MLAAHALAMLLGAASGLMWVFFENYAELRLRKRISKVQRFLKNPLPQPCPKSHYPIRDRQLVIQNQLPLNGESHNIKNDNRLRSDSANINQPLDPGTVRMKIKGNRKNY
jgi:hypothetical protein